MDEQQLNNFKQWFRQYVDAFYGQDEYINANIKLKDEHSYRVCGEMRYLVKKLGLDDYRRRIAETCAIFHDVGRFPQFLKYQTYNDPRSENHSLLAVKVLKETKVLESLDEREQNLILTAIRHHGEIDLTAELDEDEKFFCKIMRDADKLDIYRVVTTYYVKYRQDPENYTLEVELPDEPTYSPHMVKAIFNEAKVEYSTLKVWNDMKLLQLGWIFDINFTASLERVKQKGYLELILDFLPDNEEIDHVRQKIFQYLDDRINMG
jgi:hypothetical protein